MVLSRDAIARLTPRLLEDARIVAAWLFGSVARGTANATSDVDVGFITRGPAPNRLEDLPLALEEQLGAELGCPVQLVRLDEAPADLIHRVLRDGILIVDRDPAARVRFEVAARNRYFDMQPIWLEYRRGRGSAA